MSDSPFIRQVKVEIFPFEGKSLILEGDGSNSKLRIKFTVHKHMVSTGIPSTIQVYNLSRNLRDKLSASTDVTVALSAGWQNTKIVEIFLGSLLYVTHQREGADIVTSLMTIEGYFGLFRKVVFDVFSPNTKIADLVLAMAMQIPNIQYDKNFIDIPDSVKLGNQGKTQAGSVDRKLDELARVYGFTWWIDNGIFYAKTDGQPFKKAISNFVLVNRTNGLLRADPMLCLAVDQLVDRQTGITINSMLNPAIKIGGTVQLQSSMNSQLDGDYEVHNVVHSGDTHENAWTTRVESMKYFDSAAWK